MCIVISHRGYCIDAPEYENTSHAMLRAISLGIRHLEFDIRMTADHEIVLFHDSIVRIDDQEVPVAKLDHASLAKKYPMTERFDDFLHSILSATTPDIELTFVVDAKTDHRDNMFGDKLIDTLRTFDSTYSNASFVITSFDHRLIGDIQHSIDAWGLPFTCGYILYSVPTAAEIETYPCEWIGFYTHTLTKPVVEDAHSAGKKVFVYTPNDTDEFDRCGAMGVDGIYTDDVKLYLEHEDI